MGHPDGESRIHRRGADGPPDGGPAGRGRPRRPGAGPHRREAPRSRAIGRRRGRRRSAEAGAQADVVVLCVFTDEQVRRGLPGQRTADAAMPSGSALVVHTTGKPEHRRDHRRTRRRMTSTWSTPPVSGGPHDVAAGRLTLFVGGADDAVARVQPGAGLLRRSRPARRAARRRPEGEAGQQRAVRGAHRVARGVRPARRAARRRRSRRCWPRCLTAARPAGCWTSSRHGVPSRPSSR